MVIHGYQLLKYLHKLLKSIKAPKKTIKINKPFAVIHRCMHKETHKNRQMDPMESSEAANTLNLFPLNSIEKRKDHNSNQLNRSTSDLLFFFFWRLVKINILDD